MGSYDGAEICELVGLYLLNEIKTKVSSIEFGLYRDDGLGITRKLSGPHTERLKKDIIKLFQSNNLKITIECNLYQANFLDVAFDLRTGKYSPYRKPNDTPLYIHCESNHPPNILKQLPSMIANRISSISCDQQSKAKEPYNTSLKMSGFSHDIMYATSTPQNVKPRQRKRKIIWFNPPYNLQVKTNIGRTFLASISKHFPPSHKYHKIFNKNTIKLSYSCTPNIKAAISKHNKRIMSTIGISCDSQSSMVGSLSQPATTGSSPQPASTNMKVIAGSHSQLASTNSNPQPMTESSDSKTTTADSRSQPTGTNSSLQPVTTGSLPQSTTAGSFSHASTACSRPQQVTTGSSSQRVTRSASQRAILSTSQPATLSSSSQAKVCVHQPVTQSEPQMAFNSISQPATSSTQQQVIGSSASHSVTRSSTQPATTYSSPQLAVSSAPQPAIVSSVLHPVTARQRCLQPATIGNLQPAAKRMCNCHDPTCCPMVGSCLEQCVIYKATVSSSEGEKHYIGATELTFKTRFTNHKESFVKQSKSSSTTLSKHIWDLKGRGISYTIKWEIIRRCPPYKCGTRRCDLCLSEKYFILKANSEHCLNRNFELLQKCRHSNKFKLGNFSKTTSSAEQRSSSSTTSTTSGCSTALTAEEIRTVASGKLLCDNITTAAMELVEKLNPALKTYPASLCAIPEQIEPNLIGTVQVHHNGAKHWVASSSLDGEIRVYDSLNIAPTRNLIIQLAARYSPGSNTPSMSRVIKQMRMAQRQQGSRDCGLFAIAYVVDLAQGVDPAQVKYDQPSMRRHLLKCFAQRVITPFPREDGREDRRADGRNDDDDD